MRLFHRHTWYLSSSFSELYWVIQYRCVNCGTTKKPERILVRQNQGPWQ